jgi:hypothetical protein
VHFLEEPTCTPLECIRTSRAGNYRHGNTKRGLVSPIVNQSELRVDEPILLMMQDGSQKIVENLGTIVCELNLSFVPEIERAVLAPRLSGTNLRNDSIAIEATADPSCRSLVVWQWTKSTATITVNASD